jgi:hypothetical protein
MHSFAFNYTAGSRPAIEKTLTASSGETLTAQITYENEHERNSLTSKNVYEHLENLLQYIKDKSTGLSLIHEDEENDGDGWHLNGGWAEINWANEEILKWWEFAYYNELPITQNDSEPTP